MTEGPAAEGRAAWDRAQEQLSKELHARVLRKIEADGMAARQTRIFMQGIGKLQPTTEERRYIGCAYLVTKERADAEGTAGEDEGGSPAAARAPRTPAGRRGGAGGGGGRRP